MSSVSKALELLSLFSPTRPEIGLSQLCRLAGRDKATTYRHLQALQAAHLLERNTLTRAYRLGPAVLHLASMREVTVPRKRTAEKIIARLAEQTGETAHVCVLSGSTLFLLAACQSQQYATRAVVDLTTLPLHATASGITALAFGPAGLMDAALTDLQEFTSSTPSCENTLKALVSRARQVGFGRSERFIDEETQSLSAPLYDHSGHYAGSISVASVSARFNHHLEQRIMTHLIEACREVTRSWGGTIPAYLEAAWARSLPVQRMRETG